MENLEHHFDVVQIDDSDADRELLEINLSRFNLSYRGFPSVEEYWQAKNTQRFTTILHVLDVVQGNGIPIDSSIAEQIALSDPKAGMAIVTGSLESPTLENLVQSVKSKDTFAIEKDFGSYFDVLINTVHKLKTRRAARETDLVDRSSERYLEDLLQNQVLDQVRQGKSYTMFLAKLDNTVSAILHHEGINARDQEWRFIASAIRQFMGGSYLATSTRDFDFCILLPCTQEEGRERAFKLSKKVNLLPRQYNQEWYHTKMDITVVPITQDMFEPHIAENTVPLLSKFAAQETAQTRNPYVRMLTPQIVQKKLGYLKDDMNLRSALTEKRLRLFAQPIVSLDGKTDEGQSYEVLLRIEDRNGHMHSPFRYLQAARRYENMTAVDREVIAVFCDAYRDLYAHNPARLTTASINLSGESMKDMKIVDYIDKRIQSCRNAGYRIDTNRITIECTETIEEADFEKSIEVMKALKELGFRLAIDDIGVGSSNARNITILPADIFKIDMSFVKDLIHENPHTRYYAEEFISYIQKIAARKGVLTVAEGVENLSLDSRVREFGINKGQGYYYGRPELLWKPGMHASR